MAIITKRTKKQKHTSKTKLLTSKRFAYGLCVVSALILLASLVSWWHFVASSPDNVFANAISNSFKTTGVVRQVTQKQEGAEVSEVSAVNTSGPHTVHSLTTLNQGGTEYQREAIGTTSDYYVRYTGIKSDEKDSAGKPHDFSSVLNKWGKADKEAGGDQYYNEVTLLNVIVPLGNLPASARRDVMAQIKADDTYHFDKKTVKRTIKNGRPTYSYDVTVDLAAYIKTLKKFASGTGVSVPQLEAADPAQYKGQPPLKFVFTVDVWSKQLTQVEYKDSGRVEKAGSYGLRRTLALPTKTIDINELQTSLQKLQ